MLKFDIMNRISVTITRKYIYEGQDYMNGRDCPLYKAIIDQHPNIIQGSFRIGGFGGIIFIGHSVINPLEGTNEWDADVYDTMESGEIESVTLTYDIPEYFINPLLENI